MPEASEVNRTFDPSGEIDGPPMDVVARNCSMVYCFVGRLTARACAPSATAAGFTGGDGDEGEEEGARWPACRWSKWSAALSRSMKLPWVACRHIGLLPKSTTCP